MRTPGAMGSRLKVLPRKQSPMHYYPCSALISHLLPLNRHLGLFLGTLRSLHSPNGGIKLKCTLHHSLALASSAHSLYSGPALGDGPTRSVLRAGVRKVTENSPIFGLRGEFYHPLFFPVASSYRENAFWVAGFWSAIHVIALRLTPDPITPWLLYAAVYGRDGFPTDLQYIRALDPVSAATLEPWYAFQFTDTLRDGVLGPVQQLLMTYLDIHEVCRLLYVQGVTFESSGSSSVHSDNRDPRKNMMPSRRTWWLLSF